jgi:CubicO group peptidase (beta-lactamase class C family)
MRWTRETAAGLSTIALACATFVLANGCGPPAEPKAPAAAPAAAPGRESARRIDEILTGYHDIGQLEGTVLVAERGQILYQRSFGLANREWQVPNSLDARDPARHRGSGHHPPPPQPYLGHRRLHQLPRLLGEPHRRARAPR